MATTQKGRHGTANTLPAGPHLMPCDVLVGEVVVNRDDETLGELAHLVIDMARGKVTHVVIARGGVLGLGEKLHAIPWSAVTLDSQRHRLVADIARERMDRAEGFDLEALYSRKDAGGDQCP